MFVHTVIMVIEPHMKQGRQHKLISTIFLATSVTKKLDHNNLRKDVSVMCNLSQGIEEKGIAIGRAEGEAGLIIKMYKNGFTAEQIASATDKDIEEVKAIIAGKEPALA